MTNLTLLKGKPLLSCMVDVASLNQEKNFLSWVEDNEKTTWSYSEFLQGVLIVAELLNRKFGINQGSYVHIFAKNSPEFLLIWFACYHLDAIPVLLNTSWKKRQIDYILRNFSPSLVVIDEELREHYPEKYNFLVVGSHEFDHKSILFNIKKSKFPLEKIIENFLPTKKLNNFYSILFSSGTSTGKPKAIKWRHENIINAAIQTAGKLKLSPHDITLCYTPLFHTLALSYQVFSTIYSGGLIVLQRNFNAQTFWDISINEKCTWTSMLGLCFSQIRRKEYPQSNYRFFLTGLRVPFIEEACDVYTVGIWGMTETVSPAIIATEIDAPKFSMGKPLDCFDIRVVDSNTNYVPPNSPGELQIRAKKNSVSVADYLIFEESNSKTKDGWFCTGDIVKLDVDGYLYFIERSGDRLRIGDENVSAKEIEEVIIESKMVKDVAVVGKPDSFAGELAVAFIIPKSNTNINSIIDKCKKDLPHYQVPHKIIPLDEFPRSTLDKICKYKLRELVKQLELKGSNDSIFPIDKEQVTSNLHSIWTNRLSNTKIKPDSDFFSIGGSSISMIEIIRDIEFTMKVQLSPADFHKYNTISKLANFILSTELSITPKHNQKIKAIRKTGSFPINQNLIKNKQNSQIAHFTCSFCFDISNTEVTFDILDKVIHTLSQKHLILRSTVSTDVNEKLIHSVDNDKSFNYSIKVDFSNIPVEKRLTEFENYIRHLPSKTFKFTKTDPLFKVYYFNLGNEFNKRVFVVWHHWILDQMGAEYLVREIVNTTRSVLNMEKVFIDNQGSTIYDWHDAIKKYVDSNKIEEKTYWTHLPWSKTSKLPLDVFDGSTDTLLEDFNSSEKEVLNALWFGKKVDEGQWDLFTQMHHRGVLEEELTKVLYSPTIQDLGFSPIDIILLSLSRAFSSWSKNQFTLYRIKNNGRGLIFPEIDVTRALGDVAFEAPLIIESTENSVVIEELSKIKQLRTSIPTHGVGYEWLRNILLDKDINALPHPQIVLNYLEIFQSSREGSTKKPLFQSVNTNFVEDSSQELFELDRVYCEISINEGCLYLRSSIAGNEYIENLYKNPFYHPARVFLLEKAFIRNVRYILDNIIGDCR